MKKSFFTLMLFCFAVAVFARDAAVRVNVVFENAYARPLTQGTLTITDVAANTLQFVTVTNAADLALTLPQSGKYVFTFYADGFTSEVSYPKRITEKNNLVVVRLRNNPAENATVSTILLSDFSGTQPDRATIEQLAKAGNLSFVYAGISAALPVDITVFKERYGIGGITYGCLTHPTEASQIAIHNQLIANYLTDKYGNEWKKALAVLPEGI